MKTLTAFIAAVIAAIFGGSFKALSVETKTLPEPTIEERLANVREQLRNQQRQIISESDTLLSSFFSSKDEKKDDPPKEPQPSPSPSCWCDKPSCWQNCPK